MRTIGLVCLALLAACGGSGSSHSPAPAPTTPAAPERPKPTYGTFGFDTDGMDRTVEPGDDFYRYANGGWLDRTEIPADRSNWGMFSMLSEEAGKRTRTLIEGAGAGGSGDARKIADAYAAFMDETTIEGRGTEPLAPELGAIFAIKTRKQLASLLGQSLRADVDVLNTAHTATDRLFGLWVAEDLDDPSRYRAYLLQGGLGLPDRDYYLGNSERFVEIRKKYETHIAAMMRLANLSESEADARRRARRVLALERKIAQAHATQVDTRDVAKGNNPWPRAAFARKAPGIDWAAYFAAAGLATQDTITVWHPRAIAGIARLVGREPIPVWKDYLAFRAVSRAAPYLPRAFVDEWFLFNGRVLAGAEQLPERWKRAVDFVNTAMGEAVGRIYVEKYFPPAAKAEADRMVKNIVAALGQRIDRLDWMTAETKAKAKQKLSSLQVSIGHPAKWRDYSGLEIAADDAFGNAERASRFELARNLAKLGQPVDRTEWFMVPQEVNALNAPQQNSIIFPAAILQPPFFDPAADPAINYGGIGAVIGHEIVHSFDDTGAMFDAQGKLSNWWTKEDAEKFKAAGEALVAQYSAYRPFEDLGVNGKLTLGENIADLAGVAIAHEGYLLSLGGKPAPVLDGFTGDQRVFLGFAQVWRRKYREPTLRRYLMVDGHSPAPYRAATVRNQDAWYEAFEVEPGQKLYLAPEARVRVW